MTTKVLNYFAAFCVIATAVAFPFTTSAAGPLQWSTESGGNGHYYGAFSAPNGISWEQASNAAVRLGGYLATVTSAEENDFIYNNLVTNDDSLWNSDIYGNGIGPWLGGWQRADSSETSGGWAWVTGEPFSFNAWDITQPDDGDGFENGAEDRLNYIGVHTAKGKTWNDFSNDPEKSDQHVVKGYIVEWSSDPSAAAHRNIAVYRIGVPFTRFGDERVKRGTVSGYMLFDIIGNNVVVLRVDPAKKLFRESMPKVAVATINTYGRYTLTAIKFQSEDLASALAKGPNVKVAVNYDASANPINVVIPMNFTVGGSDLLTSTTGETITSDYRGSIALDRLATVAANKKGLDISGCSAALQADLLSKGYKAAP